MYETTVKSIGDPLSAYWNSFVAYAPQLVAALVVLVVGLIVASIIASIVGKLLGLAENSKEVQKFLSRWNMRLSLSGFVAKFVWWAVLLVFISAAVDILQIAVLTSAINLVVGYLPSVFAAAVVAVVVLVGARVVRGLLRSALEGVGITQARGLSTAVYVVLLVFGLTTAAAQLGIDTALLSANLTVILGGVVLALAIAFGLGGREVAAKILNKMYDQTEIKPAKKRS